jgi:hypothetical protein
MSSPREDAETAYQGAQERAMLLREEWARLERPVMATGSRGQPVIHPLLGAIAEAEVVADRLRQRLLKTHPGPQPSAVLGIFSQRKPSKPKPLGPSPAAVLRQGTVGDPPQRAAQKRPPGRRKWP